VTGSAGEPQGSTYAWADRKGTTQPITTSPQLWGIGRLSPDGTRIANGLTNTTGEQDIWIYEIGRAVSTRLTFDGGNNTPIWSPDGRRIVYGGTRDGKSGIYAVAADGSGRPEPLLSTDGRRAIPTSFTPDGKTLVYTLFGAAASNTKTQIMVLTAGSPAAPLHESSWSERGGQLSPDGKWLAYLSAESGSLEIYVQPFPGPGAKVKVSLQTCVYPPRWGRNMPELFYWQETPPSTKLMAVDIRAGASFKAGTPQPLFAMTTGSTWDVAPDQTRFLIELSPTLSDGGGSPIVAVTNWFEELRQRAPAKK
jgi:Tol biopolymer transport system component